MYKLKVPCYMSHSTNCGVKEACTLVQVVWYINIYQNKSIFWHMTVGIYRKEDDGEQATNEKWLVSAKKKIK